MTPAVWAMLDGTRAAEEQPGPRDPEPKIHDRLAAPRPPRKWLAWLVPLVLSVAGAIYFFQSATLAPDHTDEGLMLQYVDAMANGQRPYFDFVDAYGIANWVMPVLFYEALGQRVWGVRLWLVVVKVLSLVAAFALVRRLAIGSGASSENPDSYGERSRRGNLYGALAVAWVAILLGARWSALQMVYAAITVLPLMLGAWYFILCAPFDKRFANICSAGVLTALAIWTKVNAGMYLLAGGLFAYFFWLPNQGRTGEQPSREPSATPRWFKVVGSAGLASYFAVFTLCVLSHYNVWFFLYLTLPLMMGIGFAFFLAVWRSENADLGARLRSSLTYFGTSTGLGLLVLFGYHGRYAWEYVEELAGIIATVNYAKPFPPLGEEGQYVGLTEYYWLQLPWAVTAGFAVWVVLGARRGPRTFGSAWPDRVARTAALFMLFVTHAFVMYARADETHVYPVLVLAPIVLFALLADLDAFLAGWRPRLLTPARSALAAGVILFSSTLFVVPSASDFLIERGDWDNPKLEHLQFRSGDGKYKRPESVHIDDMEWDVVENEAANYLKKIVRPKEPILILTANRLLHFNTDTVSVGGRYHYHLFLACVGLLDREGFDKLVPPEIIDEIVANPPRVIVSAYESSPLADVIPEFERLRDSRYVLTRSFRHILIYELRDSATKL